MGTIIDFNCKECKNNIEYYIGIGFMYFQDNVFHKNIYENEKPIIYDLVKNIEIKNIVVEKLRNGFIPDDEYGKELYYCKKCKTVDIMFYFSLFKNDEIFIPKYECDICNDKLERLENILEKNDIEYNNRTFELKYNLEIKCKKCGSNNIKFSECGNWD
jgi:hypothetical protein